MPSLEGIDINLAGELMGSILAADFGRNIYVEGSFFPGDTIDAGKNTEFF